MLIDVRRIDGVAGPVLAVTLLGEVDLVGANRLCEVLLDALYAPELAVLVEAGGVTSCHESGARALLIAEHAARRRGKCLVLVAPSEAVSISLEVLTGAERLVRGGTLAHALRLSGGDQGTPDQPDVSPLQ